MTDHIDEIICRWQEKLVAEVNALRADRNELLADLFTEIAGAPMPIEEGGDPVWYDSCGRIDAKRAGDRLVELGLWERRPNGTGRRWFYRPLADPPQTH